MRNVTRTVFIYCTLWLALTIFVKLSFAALTFWFYALADSQVPGFEKDVLALQQRYPNDPERLQEGLFELMKPAIEGENWRSIRILLSLGVFAPIAFLAGFLSGDPRWAGSLPVFALLPPSDPSNPAVMLFPHVPKAEIGEQIMLLLLQIVVVYACAWSGAVRYWRRRGTEMSLDDDEETSR